MSSIRFISKFLRFLVQNEKRFIFAISDFPNLQYARKLQSFSTKMHQRIIWKVIEKQYSSSNFLHKAVIKRECGVHCTKQTNMSSATAQLNDTDVVRE